MSNDFPPVDQYGFLVDSDNWNRDVARVIALRLGIDWLTERHFAVLSTFQCHYRHYRAIPPASHVCRELELDGPCIDELFRGPLNAWLIAGLPNPGEEARVYLGNQTAP